LTFICILSFSLGIYWTYINKIRELSATTGLSESTLPPSLLSYSDDSGILPATLSPKSLSDLVWTFGSNYILPIILNAMQLATASLMPSSNAASLIDSAKVVLNIASASVAALRKQLPALAAQASLEMKEGLSRVTKTIPATASSMGANEVIAPARDRDQGSEETADPTESETKETTS
jgi:hypothetical protein